MVDDLSDFEYILYVCIGDNMLISKDGRVCLSDFGLAKKIDSSR